MWVGDRERVNYCLDEIIRLRAENEWLRSQMDLVAAATHREAVDELMSILGIDGEGRNR